LVAFNAPQEPAATATADAAAPTDTNAGDAGAGAAQSVSPTVPVDPSATAQTVAADDAPSVPNNLGPVVSSAVVELRVEGESADGAAARVAQISEGTLKEALLAVAAEVGVPLTERVVIVAPLGDNTSQWSPGSQLQYSKWKVDMPLAADQADKIMARMKEKMSQAPVWVSSSSVGSRVAGDMVGRAMAALFASLLCIIGYIWFRFQGVLYGLAAVAALVHDVLVTLGAIAISYWLADALGFLLIDPFKIGLTVVAAILTLIGYSLNDTIVVFDRIRETKGKAPRLTSDMVNSSINQTLSRTTLTSMTTWMVVLLLYFFGGEGIHAFAFSLVVGVVVGTYSSIFVASPILLWLLQRRDQNKAAQPKAA
jgi:SecD/SecF fusion protein